MMELDKLNYVRGDNNDTEVISNRMCCRARFFSHFILTQLNAR